MAKNIYVVDAYEKKDGVETLLRHGDYDLWISPSLIFWDDEKEIKTENETTLIFYPSIKQDDFRCILPTGVQIYRGKDKEHMKLVHTVRCENLSGFHSEEEIYEGAKYIDKRKSHEDYYQIRSYIDMDGKRWYGKKSEIRLFREKGYRGEVEARVKMKPRKKYIKKIEVEITNPGKLPIKVGMPYIKNYYKDEKFQGNYMFMLYDTDTSPYCSSDNLKIDKVEYKSRTSGRYKKLSGNATISIKPGEKMTLAFSRKNGRKLKNYFYEWYNYDVEWTELVGDMSIYLFQYKEKKSFINILIQKPDGKMVFYSSIENDESGEPYYEFYD